MLLLGVEVAGEQRGGALADQAEAEAGGRRVLPALVAAVRLHRGRGARVRRGQAVRETRRGRERAAGQVGDARSERGAHEVAKVRQQGSSHH